MFSIANQQLPGKNLDLQNAREIDNIFMRLQNAVEPKTENSRKVLASKSRVFDEFSSQYKEFLRKVHSLDNLAEVVEFGRMLTDKLPLNPEPTDEQKESLKAETVEMVSQARSTLTVFIDKRQEEIEALQKMINTANQMLENPKILRTGELFWKLWQSQVEISFIGNTRIIRLAVQGRDVKLGSLYSYPNDEFFDGSRYVLEDGSLI